MSVFTSRLLALALLVLVLSGLWLLVGLPLSERLAADQATLAEQKQTLARYEALAAAEPSLRQQLEALAHSQPMRDLLLPGTTETQAAAALQERAKSVLAESGAPLITLQPLPAKAVGGHRRIGLKLQFSADTAALQRLLHAFEAGRPLILIDSLYVRSRSGETSGFPPNSAGDSALSRPPPLDVTLELSGFMAAGSGA